MSDFEKIKELEAMILILAKRIEDLKKDLNVRFVMQSDKSLLNEIKQEAQRLKI